MNEWIILGRKVLICYQDNTFSKIFRKIKRFTKAIDEKATIKRSSSYQFNLTMLYFIVP